jgi:hypothetical protein
MPFAKVTGTPNKRSRAVKARVRTLCVNLAAAEIEGLRRLGRLSPIVAVRCTPAALMLAAAIIAAWTILVSAAW